MFPRANNYHIRLKDLFSIFIRKIETEAGMTLLRRIKIMPELYPYGPAFNIMRTGNKIGDPPYAISDDFPALHVSNAIAARISRFAIAVFPGG